MSKQWFQVQNRAGVADIFILDEISAFGISAKQLIAQIKDLGDVKKITVHINSPGGDVFDGISIYNYLKRHPAFVEVIVEGLAASIASVVAMSANRIIMPENSMLMIHNPY